VQAEILNTLGGLAFERRKFQQAESFYKRTIALVGRAPGAELGAALIGLSAISLETGDLASGLRFSQEALRAYEEASGPEHPKLVVPLVNIAYCMRKSGDPESAEPFARRGAELAERTLGSAHPHTAAALLEYGQVLRRLNRKRDAKTFESRARSILGNSARNDPSAAYTIDAGRLAAAKGR